MELTIRDWMVIVGVLLIMAVLLDAWRRIRRDKHSQVRMKLVDPDELPPAPADDIRMYGELPNGGARVVERGDILRAAGYSGTKGKSGTGSAAKAPRKRVERAHALLQKLSGCAEDHGAPVSHTGMWRRIEREVRARQQQIALP